MKTIEADNGLAFQLTGAGIPTQDVRVYEYGLRLVPETAAIANDQIMLARRLYNDIVAAMRSTYDEMDAWVLERAGDGARDLQRQLELVNLSFDAAKARNDESLMKEVATTRRGLWKELGACLGIVRKAYIADLRELFYSRIGKSKGCVTYELRCRAVNVDGLGWATANAVLDRALIAWKTSMQHGKPPQFAKGAEILQDSLNLQFTTAGGVPVDRIMQGGHGELSMTCATPAARRAFGEMKFRLGSATAMKYATGTWLYHRPVPEGAFATGARLVRRRVADKFKWVIQVVLRLPEAVRRATAPKSTLACVHFGWAADDDGRVVAGVADAADPGLARLVQLPPSIEEDFRRAADIQAARDKARDDTVEALKAISQDGLPDEVAKEFQALKLLRPQYIAAKRYYRVQWLLQKNGGAPAWLNDWVATDRKQWQATVGIARRARLRRREFYRTQAQGIAASYSAVVVESLDLKAAATKIDKASGERSEFNRRARAGRQAAAVSEFNAEILKACGVCDTAVFELTGAPTIRICAHCGSENAQPVEDSLQEIVCADCGAVANRKCAGAAMAWQFTSAGIEDSIVDYHASTRAEAAKQAEDKEARKVRMAEGRRAARSLRTGAAGDAKPAEEST